MAEASTLPAVRSCIARCWSASRWSSKMRNVVVTTRRPRVDRLGVPAFRMWEHWRGVDRMSR